MDARIRSSYKGLARDVLADDSVDLRLGLETSDTRHGEKTT